MASKRFEKYLCSCLWGGDENRDGSQNVYLLAMEPLAQESSTELKPP
jgi:hypothetical protein